MFRAMKGAGLMSAAMLAAMAHADWVGTPTQADVRSARRRLRATPETADPALLREIAEHNAEVDRRRAEKLAAKAKKRGG